MSSWDGRRDGQLGRRENRKRERIRGVEGISGIVDLTAKGTIPSHPVLPVTVMLNSNLVQVSVCGTAIVCLARTVWLEDQTWRYEGGREGEGQRVRHRG